MTALVDLLQMAIAIPAVAACIYLLGLTLLSSRLPTPPRSSRTLRFDVIVPAHNEARVIERTLASLRKLDWPTENVRLIVIADNCDDDTARLARAAGSHVVVRTTAAERSKGYALRVAFDLSLRAAFADAVVVVDADTEVSHNLLEAFASRIERGAGAIQANYGVLNPEDSWRTGLMAIAHGAFHGVRSRARERLGLSCGLRGNGWCVTRRVLRAVPYRAFSVTEDLEYGVALGLGGSRVEYAGEADALSIVETAQNVAGRQRQRWEDGRFELVRTQTIPLLLAAVRYRNWVCLDLAADLLVLPLSYIALNVVGLLAVTALMSRWDQSLLGWALTGAICVVSLMMYVLRGWQISGRGMTGLRDLLVAPFFIAWKIGLAFRPHDRHEWVATKRRTQ